MQGWTAPAALAAARSGKPSVYVFQGVLHESDFARPRVRSLVMRAARECDTVTAYSDIAASEFTRITGIDCQAIEPGIDLRAFTPGGERHPTPAIFCAADPNEPRKRVALLVEAFRQLGRSDAELWLMNTGDAAIRSTPGVRIVDPGADRDELIRLYRSAWVSVLPAMREAFGLVVVESLACGTPALGMEDGGAVAGLVKARGSSALAIGAIAEPNPEALAAVLRAATQAPPGATTAAACRRRAEDFSIERCADGYQALYQRLV